MKIPADKKKKTKKIIFAVVASLTAVILLSIWGVLCFIQIYKYETGDFDGYEGTELVAHRGSCSEYFDNTEAAFNAASVRGAFSGIETDIRRTADGVWVCSHDDNPFFDKSVKITESDYAGIKDLALDTSGAYESAIVTGDEKICLYSTYLAACRAGGKFALIEIKGKYGSDELETPVSEAVAALGYKKFFFASFDLSSVSAVHKVDTRVRTLLFSGNAFLAYCYTEMGSNVGLSFGAALAYALKHAHDLNHLCFVYGITSAERLETVENMHVDYAISDYVPY
jgi:glycerophosphoryl diester phosphodiesterase